MKTIYTKMNKHNREENVMKGFIEVMNQIKNECGKHDICSPECAFFICADEEGNCECCLHRPPEYFDTLEIMRRLQAHD